MDNLIAFPWLFAIAAGALLLSMGMAHAMHRTRRVPASRQLRGHADGRDMYRRDDYRERF